MWKLFVAHHKLARSDLVMLPHTDQHAPTPLATLQSASTEVAARTLRSWNIMDRLELEAQIVRLLSQNTTKGQRNCWNMFPLTQLHTRSSESSWVCLLLYLLAETPTRWRGSFQRLKMDSHNTTNLCQAVRSTGNWQSLSSHGNCGAPGPPGPPRLSRAPVPS